MFVIGHGLFMAYRERFGLLQDDSCECCPLMETAEDIFFDCPLQDEEREAFKAKIERRYCLWPPEEY